MNISMKKLSESTVQFYAGTVVAFPYEQQEQKLNDIIWGLTEDYKQAEAYFEQVKRELLSLDLLEIAKLEGELEALKQRRILLLKSMNLQKFN